MIPFFGTSRFSRALHRYGLGRCSVTKSTVWVGLPPSAEWGRTPLAQVPRTLPKLCFVEAPLQAALVEALVGSREARTVEILMIGTSHAYADRSDEEAKRAGFDMAAAVAALRGAHMPALRTLSLGEMERLWNGHCLYGKVGEIGHVFAAAPHLAALDVSGQFALRAPTRHDRLETLDVRVDDIGFSGGPLSAQTVTNLLSSTFPKLARCHLALDEGTTDARYTVPEVFFSGAGFPALTSFEIDCLQPEAATRLEAWKAERGMR